MSVYLPNNFTSIFSEFPCLNCVKPVVAISTDTLYSCVLSASENQLAQSIQLNANQAVDDVAVVSLFHNNKWRVRCLCSSVQ